MNTWNAFVMLSAGLALAMVHGKQSSMPLRADSTHQEKFDIASIRPADASFTHMRLSKTKDNGIDAVGITVLNLITIAYGLQDFQVIDAPGWVKTDRFDIKAKIDDSVPPSGRKPTAETPGTSASIWQHRLRNLLIERFGLQSTSESRQMHVYALKVAGERPKIIEATADCRYSMSARQRRLTAECIPMELFAEILSRDVHRTVMDKTGLAGKYNFTLEWTSDPGAQEIGAGPPEIYTALREQLGLKLVTETGPEPVLVIRQIMKPTPN